jgi:parallel beta-helix repeat protein
LPAAAPAEVTDCTVITSVPYAATAPGTYCLKSSLDYPFASGVAIRIYSNDVVLDLNGHLLDGSAAGAGTYGYGVLASGYSNVTVRNGSIRGFYIGVILTSGNGNVLESLHADRNTSIGLQVIGQGAVVRNSRVIGTGGATGVSLAVGIAGGGEGMHVVDNEVVATVETAGGTQFGYGIRLSSAPGAVIERNVVSNAAYGPTGSYGIYLGFSSRSTVVGNRIANMRNGIAIYNGIGLYMDNTVAGATTPFIGGTPAGATNFSF